MNRISSGSPYPVERGGWTYGGRPAARPQSREQFDQACFSPRWEGEERQVAELTGQMSRQVCARHTAGEIARLQAQVQAGTYQPDAREIAARMLLEVV